MDIEEINKEIAYIKKSIEEYEEDLVVRRKTLEQAEIQLAIARTGESKKTVLENGDYGIMGKIGWVYIGGKVLWENGTVSGWHNTEFVKYRKGNFIRQMEERQA